MAADTVSTRPARLVAVAQRTTPQEASDTPPRRPPWSAALRIARLRRDLRQVEVAQAVQVAQSTVSSWETGTGPRPDDRHFPALAQLLQVSVATVEHWVYGDLDDRIEQR